MKLLNGIIFIFSKLEFIVPLVLVPLIATLIAFVIIYIRGGRIFVDGKGIRLDAVLFGFDTKGRIRLAIAWVKLWVVMVLCLIQRQLSMPEYAMLAFLILCLVFSSAGFRKKASAFFAGLLEAGSIISVNFCYSFLNMAPMLKYVYYLLVFFTVIFAQCVFISELDSISSERSFDIEREREELYRAS